MPKRGRIDYAELERRNRKVFEVINAKLATGEVEGYLSRSDGSSGVPAEVWKRCGYD